MCVSLCVSVSSKRASTSASVSGGGGGGCLVERFGRLAITLLLPPSPSYHFTPTVLYKA